MNDRRRKDVASAITKMNHAIGILESALDEETECMDNYPENLQGGDRFAKLEESVEALGNVIDMLYEAVETLREI